MKKAFRWFLRGLLTLFLLVALAWSIVAVLIDGPGGNSAKIIAASLGVVYLLILLFVRPFKRCFLTCLLPFFSVLIWWLAIKPQNDRNWLPDVTRLPHAIFNGDSVTIENVRNFDYQSETEYSERWETRPYNLNNVIGFDVFLSYWGSPWMAHAIASWEFSDGKHLAVSIETRKEAGEEYSALLGFFRQFELYYVVADESDLIKLRTNFRKEQVYLYRLKAPPQVARSLLVDYLEEVNMLASRPRWYNALTTNCSTVIREQVGHVTELKPWNWKMLANGYLDELAYSRGQIDTSLPFSETKAKAYINEKAERAAPGADFSAAIRNQ